MLALEEVLCELHGEHTNEQGLPPGFRFHPTDEELVTFYLASKVFHGTFSGVDIAEIDLNRCEPWELPDRAKIGEREWYFFSLRDRKYPTGLRTNRATGAGYWKATGKDKEIYSAASPTNSNVNPLLGMKKTLVFYKGRAPRGQKTKWVMHEYRLVDQPSSSRHTCKDEWVICRIQHKAPSPGSGSAGGGEDKKTPSLLNNYLLKPTSFSASSLPPLFESSTQIHHQEITTIPPAVSMGFQPTSFASSCLTNNTNPSQSSLLLKTLLSNQDCSSWNEQYDEIRNYSTQVVDNNMQWARMQQQQKDLTSSTLCSDMHGGLWGWSQKYGGNVCSSDSVNRAGFHMMLDPLFRASPLEFGTLNV